ncbi:MAG: hypothetical protein AAF823_06065 [Planctomycetota bacterium]
MITVWPAWWQWDLSLSPRMAESLSDLGVTEPDVLTMLELADRFRPARVAGRYVVEAEHADTDWDITIEPDRERNTLTIVSAKPLD